MAGVDLGRLGPMSEPQEAHHIVSGKCAQGVVEQIAEDGEEAGSIREHEVGRDLAGVDAPVVRAEALGPDGAEPGVDPAGEGVEESAPPPSGEGRDEPLGERQIVDPQQSVLIALESDAARRTSQQGQLDPQTPHPTMLGETYDLASRGTFPLTEESRYLCSTAPPSTRPCPWWLRPHDTKGLKWSRGGAQHR
jgi:hypothetical protein